MASFHQGGLGAVVDALVKAVEAHGGEICTKLRVDQVGLPWAIPNPMVFLGVTLWKSMKIIIFVEKSVKIIILKRKIHENHRFCRKIYEKRKIHENHPFCRKIYENHRSWRKINENHYFEEEHPWKSSLQKTNEHHHSEEENLWNSSFKKHQWSPSFWRGKPMKIIFFFK